MTNDERDDINDERIDLTALDPTADASRFNGIATTIGRDAMAARARQPNARDDADVFTIVAQWSRPALLAAGLIIGLAVPALVRLRAGAVPQHVGTLGIPVELNALINSRRTPSLAELSAALNPEDPSWPR